MASGFYNKAAHLIATGSINLDSDTLKVMLIGTGAGGYVFNPDHDFVDNGGNDSTDPSFNELNATNYTGGFNGAGRKTLATTWSEDDANNRAKCVSTDLTWSSLGGASNDTVAAAIVIKEVTNDTASILVAYWDLTDTPTNGGDFTLTMDGTNGNLRITT